MKKFLCALLLLTNSVMAAEDFTIHTGRDLLTMCAAFDEIPDEGNSDRIVRRVIACANYLNGFLGGFIVVDEKKPAVCVPSSISAADVWRSGLRLARRAPELTQQKANIFLYAALLYVYPCSQ
ncbi:MAG: hypothetical protein HYZ18_04265 [Pseudogulbenkiania sp.]|nr:hypothetical protein [Pseudogulbenkiania sp.]